ANRTKVIDENITLTRTPVIILELTYRNTIRYKPSLIKISIVIGKIIAKSIQCEELLIGVCLSSLTQKAPQYDSVISTISLNIIMIFFTVLGKDNSGLKNIYIPNYR
ncbi:hypothetical protein, partial [Xenorhabdus bovienii]|uniref:hypothetical protein n=1 Tax=Xenorhabdus bovienii TaxID=40576 RepID=UPI0023B276BF